MTKIEKIRDKVRKLLELASNNPSDNEAAVAFAAASDLANRYALDIDRLLEVEDDEPEREVEGVQRRCVVHWNRRVFWKVNLLNSIAVAHRCKVYSCAGYGGGAWVYGQPSDMDTVEYLYSAISKDVDQRARAYVKECAGQKRSRGRSYRFGMCHEIGRRLKESSSKMIASAKTEAYAKAGEAGLVRMNQLDVYVEKVEETISKYAEDELNLSKKPVTYSYTADASYAAGRKEGRDVNLGGNKEIGG